MTEVKSQKRRKSGDGKKKKKKKKKRVYSKKKKKENWRIYTELSDEHILKLRNLYGVEGTEVGPKKETEKLLTEGTEEGEITHNILI